MRGNPICTETCCRSVPHEYIRPTAFVWICGEDTFLPSFLRLVRRPPHYPLAKMYPKRPDWTCFVRKGPLARVPGSSCPQTFTSAKALRLSGAWYAPSATDEERAHGRGPKITAPQPQTQPHLTDPEARVWGRTTVPRNMYDVLQRLRAAPTPKRLVLLFGWLEETPLSRGAFPYSA